MSGLIMDTLYIYIYIYSGPDLNYKGPRMFWATIKQECFGRWGFFIYSNFFFQFHYPLMLSPLTLEVLFFGDMDPRVHIINLLLSMISH